MREEQGDAQNVDECAKKLIDRSDPVRSVNKILFCLLYLYSLKTLVMEVTSFVSFMGRL